MLTGVVAFLLYLTFTAEHRVDTVSTRERPSVTVDVIGSKWEWTFRYRDYAITERSGTVGRQPLVVPTGEAVRFNLATVDVIHAFWVPEVRFKRDLIPGATQSVTLVFPDAGQLPGAVRRVLRAASRRHGVQRARRRPGRVCGVGAQRREGADRVSATAPATAPGTHPRLSGWVGAATSTDHKRIGLNLGLCSLAFFLLGGVFALLMRSQIAQPNEHFVSDNTYNQLFTMHGSTMIYLFVTPMAIALAIYLVPLQLGATGMAAPRLTLTGFWVWLSGGLIMESSWLTADGAGRAGWFSYTPLSDGTNTPGVGQDLWVWACCSPRSGCG